MSVASVGARKARRPGAPWGWNVSCAALNQVKGAKANGTVKRRHQIKTPPWTFGSNQGAARSSVRRYCPSTCRDRCSQPVIRFVGAALDNPDVKIRSVLDVGVVHEAKYEPAVLLVGRGGAGGPMVDAGELAGGEGRRTRAGGRRPGCFKSGRRRVHACGRARRCRSGSKGLRQRFVYWILGEQLVRPEEQEPGDEDHQKSEDASSSSATVPSGFWFPGRH